MKFQTWHEEKISQASTVKKLTYWQETEDKVTVDARNNVFKILNENDL